MLQSKKKSSFPRKRDVSSKILRNSSYSLNKRSSAIKIMNNEEENQLESPRKKHRTQEKHKQVPIKSNQYLARISQNHFSIVRKPFKNKCGTLMNFYKKNQRLQIDQVQHYLDQKNLSLIKRNIANIEMKTQQTKPYLLNYKPKRINKIEHNFKNQRKYLSPKNESLRKSPVFFDQEKIPCDLFTPRKKSNHFDRTKYFNVANYNEKISKKVIQSYQTEKRFQKMLSQNESIQKILFKNDCLNPENNNHRIRKPKTAGGWLKQYPNQGRWQDYNIYFNLEDQASK